jgi:hypothetical protein
LRKPIITCIPTQKAAEYEQDDAGYPPHGPSPFDADFSTRR